MDTARYADMSDPERNFHFRRRWDAPPLKVERPPTGDTVERARIDLGDSSESAYNEIRRRVQEILRRGA